MSQAWLVIGSALIPAHTDVLNQVSIGAKDSKTSAHVSNQVFYLVQRIKELLTISLFRFALYLSPSAAPAPANISSQVGNWYRGLKSLWPCLKPG